MKADFVIDNMPKDAKPTYDCATDATPYVFKPGKDYGGCSIAGTVVEAKKRTKRRYTVPLYPITEKILEQVSHVVGQFRMNGYWMKGIVMCIQENKIGLACHDPRLRQKKKLNPEEKALLKRVREASSSHVNNMEISDELIGKVMGDCQKVVKNNPSDFIQHAKLAIALMDKMAGFWRDSNPVKGIWDEVDTVMREWRSARQGKASVR